MKQSKKLVVTISLGLSLTLALLWMMNTRLIPTAQAGNFTVTRFDDPAPDGCNSGVDCSLREAIMAANTNNQADTITLDGGTYTLAIAGAGEDNSASGDLDITEDEGLTLIGLGPQQTIIDGGALDRVIDVDRGEVTISSVTIRNGRATNENGAGLRVQFTTDAFTLTNSAVVDNVLVANDGFLHAGSGISVNDSTLGVRTPMLITGTLIASNTAQSPPNASEGGGIGNQSALLIVSNSIIRNNQTATNGAGIANVASGILTVTNSMIADNVSTSGSFGRGGGLANDNSNVAGSNENMMTVISSTISGNTANNRGGGIGIEGGFLTVQDSAITNNTAPDGAGIYMGGESATLENTTVTDNNGPDCGGDPITTIGGNADSDGSCGFFAVMIYLPLVIK